MPLLFGVNLDEGRYFAQVQGFATFSREAYEGLVSILFGEGAPAVLAEYPFDAFPPPYQAGYAIGAVITDGGLADLGGCPTKDLAAKFASQTPCPTSTSSPTAPHPGSTGIRDRAQLRVLGRAERRLSGREPASRSVGCGPRFLADRGTGR